MPGKVPLNNAKFTNSPDFNNQAVTGITGAGVFRKFTYTSVGSTGYTVSSSNLWAILRLSGGNSLVTVPAGITASIGDEILLVNINGTISFVTSGGATLDSSGIITLPTGRPARLVYSGTNSWILSGGKINFQINSPADCCGAGLPTVYTVGPFGSASNAYSDQYGLIPYDYKAGSVIVSPDVVNITNGVITPAPCDFVSFNFGYTFFTNTDPIYGTVALYSYLSIDANNNSQILGLPFKNATTTGVYACDTSTNTAPNGTYYRTFDYVNMQPTSPVCISGGRVTATTAC